MHTHTHTSKSKQTRDDKHSQNHPGNCSRNDNQSQRRALKAGCLRASDNAAQARFAGCQLEYSSLLWLIGTDLDQIQPEGESRHRNRRAQTRGKRTHDNAKCLQKPRPKTICAESSWRWIMAGSETTFLPLPWIFGLFHVGQL